MGAFAAAMLLASEDSPRGAPLIAPHLVVRESCQSPG
jgi:hypothetical protein